MRMLYNYMESFVSIKEVSQFLGVTTKTLRNWDKSGKLVPIRTFGGHRRYRISDIEKITNEKWDIRDKK